jgi:hypothetical protein
VSVRLTLVVALLWSGLSLVVAQPRPQIPSNELPGHERERFIDPFPQPPRSEPLMVTPKQAKPGPKRRCRDGRRSKRFKSRWKC